MEELLFGPSVAGDNAPRGILSPNKHLLVVLVDLPTNAFYFKSNVDDLLMSVYQLVHSYILSSFAQVIFIRNQPQVVICAQYQKHQKNSLHTKNTITNVSCSCQSQHTFRQEDVFSGPP